MGAGKTTLGRALAAFYKRNPAPEFPGGMRYVDLDDYVEAKAGMTIKEIFAHSGESAFRQMETEALADVAAESHTNVIVGCGGGTPCVGKNMELMNSLGITVWLQASHDVLLRRLLEAQSARPLLNGMDCDTLSAFIDTKLQERQPWYSQAQLTFNADRLESETQIAESCQRFHTAICALMAQSNRS